MSDFVFLEMTHDVFDHRKLSPANEIPAGTLVRALICTCTCTCACTFNRDLPSKDDKRSCSARAESFGPRVTAGCFVHEMGLLDMYCQGLVDSLHHSQPVVQHGDPTISCGGCSIAPSLITRPSFGHVGYMKWNTLEDKKTPSNILISIIHDGQ